MPQPWTGLFPPFRLGDSLPPFLPPFPCRAATRYIRPVANLPICQLPGTLGRELWSKWDGEMLIAGYNPPHHCHQGPSLSLWWQVGLMMIMMMMMMSGLFVRNGHPSQYHPCLHHAQNRPLFTCRVFFGNSARDPLGRWRRRMRYCLGSKVR